MEPAIAQTFPLRKLPLFARGKVLQSLEFEPLLHLAMESKVMLTVLSQSNFTKLEVWEVEWKFHRFERVAIHIHAPSVSTEILRGQGPERAEEITRTLLSISNIKRFNLSLGSYDFLNVENLFIFKYLKSFHTVELRGTTTLHPSQFKFLFDNIQAVNFSANSLKVEDKSVKRKLESWDFYPIPFASILTMKCQEVLISERFKSITEADVIDFVKVWMNGGLENLKSFDIAFTSDYLDRKLIFQGLKALNIPMRVATLNGRAVDGIPKVICREDGKEAKVQFDSRFQFDVL